MLLLKPSAKHQQIEQENLTTLAYITSESQYFQTAKSDAQQSRDDICIGSGML